MTQVAESVSVEVAGAVVTIPKDVVVNAWIERVMAGAAPAAAALPQPITLGDLRPGERYAGLILGKDGEPGYHLILLPGAVEDKTWGQAKEWAASVGGELPTRREQSLLFANLREEFEGAWYWSGEQYAGSSNHAWGQVFNDGYQGNVLKSNECRARAVRRLTI